jgi:hypothetical protein
MLAVTGAGFERNVHDIMLVIFGWVMAVTKAGGGGGVNLKRRSGGALKSDMSRVLSGPILLEAVLIS